MAQRPGDPEHRLLVSTLAADAGETLETVLVATGPGVRLAAWRCGGQAQLPPLWLREPRPLRWIGGLYAPDETPAATYRPYRLTGAFDAIAHLPIVAAEDIPPDRADGRAAPAGGIRTERIAGLRGPPIAVLVK